MEIEADSEFVANYFSFDLQEVRDWYFVHVVLAACWNVEDNADPEFFLGLAKKSSKFLVK